MKHAASLLPVLLGSALLALGVRAQTPAPAAPKTMLQILEVMKVDNAALLQRQTALLLQLEELHKEASQMKVFAKRG